MKEYNWYLRRAAVVLFPSSASSLAIPAIFFNKKGAVVAGGSIVILSLIVAIFLFRTNPRFSLWSVIASGAFMIIAVAISANIIEHSFLWAAHLPGWAAGSAYWAMLWECKDDLALVAFAFFVASEAAILAVFLSRALTFQ